MFDVLTRDEIDKARKVSRAQTGPWKTWYAEMARKTAVRRLSKYLSLSPEWAAALELDTRADTGEVTRPVDAQDEPVPYTEPRAIAAPAREPGEPSEAEIRKEEAAEAAKERK